MPEKMRNIAMGGKRHEKRVWSNKNEVLGEMKEEINEGEKGDGCGGEHGYYMYVKGGGSGDRKHVFVVDSLDQDYSNTIWTPSKVPLLQIWTRTLIRERLLVLGGRSRSHTLDVIPWMQILTRMIWTRTMTRTRLLVLGDKGLITET